MAVKGINKAIAKIKKGTAEVKRKAEAETEATAYDIADNARQLAPKNLGKLAQSISVFKKSSMFYQIRVNEKYAGYVEFGTGTLVRVPSELKDVANSIKNNPKGSFTAGLEAIKEWCRNKGIEEKAAYPIFLKILNVGINPQPFIYPAWKRGQKDYLKRLKNLLK